VVVVVVVVVRSSFMGIPMAMLLLLLLLSLFLSLFVYFCRQVRPGLACRVRKISDKNGRISGLRTGLQWLDFVVRAATDESASSY